MAAGGSETKTGTIGIVHPGTAGPHSGNRTTAERWGDIFTHLGWNVFYTDSWDGTPCDVLVALHARHSHDSILRFHRRRPSAPIVVAGTGTDLYSDVEDGGEVRESLGLARRIVVLQALAVDALPQELRDRARLIHQSVPALEARPAPTPGVFEVAFLAHVRPVKDPLCAARAAALLPANTPIRILHLGGAIDEDLAAALEREAAKTDAFTSLGSLPRPEALQVLARSRLLVSTSRHEGGANVLSEALAFDVPIVATRIPGARGILGDDYPGFFPPSDAPALAALLVRASEDEAFYEALRTACRARAWIADPSVEFDAWHRLLEELTEEA